MTTKAPKQPRALRLADSIEHKDCTATARQNAANELRRLYELNQTLYEMMNESWTVQFDARQLVQRSLNKLGDAISKSREKL